MSPFETGDRFEQKFKVSAAVHKGFIEVFKDLNPLHTNRKFAIDRGFEGKVTHGNILNGFISYFVGECLPTKEIIIHSQEILYKGAVYIDEELDFIAEVTSIFPSVNAVEFKFYFTNALSKVVAKGIFQIGLLK